MIEKIVLDHLNDNLTGITAYMEEPQNAPESYVVMQKTGSDYIDGIYMATFAVQSYANSMYNAAALNEDVKGIMDTLPEELYITKSTLNSDYNYTDTSKKKYRYQCVYDVIYVKGA